MKFLFLHKQKSHEVSERQREEQNGTAEHQRRRARRSHKSPPMHIPKPGDVVYMDSELYLSHGEDDIIGGRAEIAEVRLEKDYVWITFKDFPDSEYNWAQLEPIQAKLRDEFGNNKAHARPDYRPEFNE